MRIVQEDSHLKIQEPYVPSNQAALSDFADLWNEKQMIDNLKKGPSENRRHSYFTTVDKQTNILSNFMNVFNLKVKPLSELVEA